MGQLWQILRDNPFLLFVVLAWVVGAIANAAKAQKQARRRGASPVPTQPASRRPSPPPGPRSVGPGPRRSAEEVAAEMRRLLGLDPEPDTPPAPRSAPVEVAPSVPEPPPVRGRQVSETVSSHVESHVESHVGEAISGRKEPDTGQVGMHDGGWGTVGGRRKEVHLAVSPTRRAVELGDLRRVILGAEILGPPVALRDPDRRIV